MKTLSMLLLLTSLSTAACAQSVNFDDAKTGKGEPKWTVEKDDTAPIGPDALKQSGEATYPPCLKGDTAPKDGFVEVKFKSASDETGGKDRLGWTVGFKHRLRDDLTIHAAVGESLREGTVAARTCVSMPV